MTDEHVDTLLKAVAEGLGNSEVRTGECCGTCRTPLSEVLARTGISETTAHWETGHSVTLVAFTCSEKCSAELEATRCPTCTRLPDPVNPQPCTCAPSSA